MKPDSLWHGSRQPLHTLNGICKKATVSLTEIISPFFLILYIIPAAAAPAKGIPAALFAMVSSALLLPEKR